MNLKCVEAGLAAAAKRKAAREEDSKILELQASKVELQQPPDKASGKTNWSPWVIGGIGILAIGWYSYTQLSCRRDKQVMAAPMVASPKQLTSYSARQTADPYTMA